VFCNSFIPSQIISKLSKKRKKIVFTIVGLLGIVVKNALFQEWGAPNGGNKLFKPPIHLDKSCDPCTPPKYERIDTCMDEA
jgi:hypothetical protein